MRVTHTRVSPNNGYLIAAEYLNAPRGLYAPKFRPESRYVMYDPTDPDVLKKQGRVPQEKETDMTGKLYQTKDGKRFGTFLARNSAGKLVLELKDKAGGVEAFAPEEVEVVTPYTIGVHSDGGPAHYETPAGSVKVGDLLILGDSGVNFAVVTELDTKKDGAKPLNARRILTEAVGVAG